MSAKEYLTYLIRGATASYEETQLLYVLSDAKRSSVRVDYITTRQFFMRV
jgi:hypothetical protein